MITDILFERNGSQSSLKDVCAWLSTPASSNPHSAAPCDALIDKFFAAVLATLADMCGTLGHQQT